LAKPKLKAGGGLSALFYTLAKGREAGGWLRLYRRLRSKNTCKTCGLGMGGQKGGMTNEAGHFPEVCKKSVQAQAGDMARPIEADYFAATPIAAMAALGSAGLEKLGRIAFPLMAGPGDTHFRPIGWDQALDRAGAAFSSAAADEVFFYSSGRSSNEAAYLMQLVARAFGTNNIHNCSYYCHSASSVALSMVYGSGTASITLDDLGHADLALVAGANPASNHPRLITQLVGLRRRGGRVIVVNPLAELGLKRFRLPSQIGSMLRASTVSDLYLQPHVGGDLALFKALLKGLMERDGAIEQDYIERFASGWDEVRDDIEATPWDTLIAGCGVERAEVERAVEIIAASRRGVFMWAMGLTHHVHGVDNILALANLALARGWLGSAGAGLMPIRGHSNVQGVGSCGVAPSLKEAFAHRMEEVYQFKLPTTPGQDTYASMLAADQGRIRAAFLLGGNLFGSNPDSRWARQALARIDTTVFASTKLNQGHLLGRGRTCIILPVLARDEESQATTQESMFNYLRLSAGGTPAVDGQMRSEVDIIASLAERILPAGRFDWSALRSHSRLRQEMARVVPGYEGIDEIQTAGEFHIKGRTFHEPSFATDDGRAHFHVTPLPDGSRFEQGGDTYRLTTLRSEGQFNTVVYEQEDLYRGNRRRDVVMMSADDARGLGLDEGDRIRVETEAGAMTVHTAIVDIRPGSLAMYYPEANVLVPRRIDPRSKTPAFKSVAARLHTV
jgi:molybdopterin-dependent oxidoreductase alpha subunit